MLTTVQPDPVKVFAGILWASAAALAAAEEHMVAAWGRCDSRSPDTPFDYTDYYREEMGPGLQRRFLSFEPLASPADLPRLKHEANDIERHLVVDGKRSVNIDVGYLDYNKVVLASTKEGPCKIYQGDGIWADMTLRYRKGALEPFDWTFLDFKSGAHDTFLIELRTLYKAQRRGNA